MNVVNTFIVNCEMLACVSVCVHIVNILGKLTGEHITRRFLYLDACMYVCTN